MVDQYYLLINLTLAIFFISTVLFFIYIVSKNRIINITAFILFATGIVLNTVSLILRWNLAGYIPLSNTYETMITFAWMIALGYIPLLKSDSKRVIGFSISLLIVIVLSSASFFDDTPRPLVPALQSNWLTVHVLFCFVSYAAFTISFAASVLYLIFKEKISPVLENIIYKTILVGFPFLTLGIVTGAIWANRAWGSYWSWDPKETWAIITWFVYAAYLHSRYLKGWRGKITAWLSIIGFLFVLFTYFGVNYILSGLHSYK